MTRGPKSTKSPVRMKDLARTLGISAAAVSLALRGSPRVSAEMRLRVQAAARDMGYVYNRGAANLRTQRSRIIGVVLPDMRNPAFVRLLRAATNRLNERNRMMLLCDTGDSLDRQTFFFQTLREYGADGVLVCPAKGSTPESLPNVHDGGLPTVCIARHVADAPVDSVIGDDLEAMRMATGHLVSQGHRRIVFVGGNGAISTGMLRRAGFAEAMTKAGVPVDHGHFVDCSTDEAGGSGAVAKVLAMPERPTAAICFGDVVAFGFILGLRHAGIEPGRDMAVVGCDGVDEAEFWYPRLTTVEMGGEKIGEKAVDLLLGRIKEPDRAIEHVILPPTFCVRESCGATL